MAISFVDIQDSLQNFNINELNDLNQVGSWPMVVKVIIWFVVFVGVIALGYILHVTNLQAELAKQQKQELTMREDYRFKFERAVNLDLHKAQKLKMQAEFEAILQQLPTHTEIPGLIEDINKAGLSNNLAFSSIDLQPEIKHEFYIEKPIKISVTGSYHDLGSFVSSVASLSRIVTLHDFSIVPTTVGGRRGKVDTKVGGLLKMNIVAKTYRYNDERG
ncbi:MAG: type 4a pilus biogenesis protein PilO [Pseudomonadales bacterium]|nr:type 4a pilus biogenesis protein PilO [Pseudomonadales bacterium]